MRPISSVLLGSSAASIPLSAITRLDYAQKSPKMYVLCSTVYLLWLEVCSLIRSLPCTHPFEVGQISWLSFSHTSVRRFVLTLRFHMNSDCAGARSLLISDSVKEAVACCELLLAAKLESQVSRPSR